MGQKGKFIGLPEKEGRAGGEDRRKQGDYQWNFSCIVHRRDKTQQELEWASKRKSFTYLSQSAGGPGSASFVMEGDSRKNGDWVERGAQLFRPFISKCAPLKE